MAICKVSVFLQMLVLSDSLVLLFNCSSFYFTRPFILLVLLFYSSFYSFACSVLLALLPRSASLIGLLAHTLTYSQAFGKADHGALECPCVYACFEPWCHPPSVFLSGR